jgi:hypothetical protein
MTDVRRYTSDVGILLIVVVHWSSPSIIRAGTLRCTRLDDSRAAYQRSSRTGPWIRREVRRRSCSSQPVCSLVRRSPQPAHVTWCPGPGEESLHFPPAWRNQSLCVSWKMVSLAVICCPELMHHTLESPSRILRAPRCTQEHPPPIYLHPRQR